MLTLNFRFGDPRIPLEPVSDLYFRIGRNCYKRNAWRKPGSIGLVTRFLVLTYTRLL